MSNWSEFIASHLLYDNGDSLLEHTSFEQDNIPISNFYCDHYHYATLQISGDNSTKFLHDLTTIDIHNLNNQCMFGAFCDPKANVVSNVCVFKHEGNYLLRLPRCMSDTLLKHLNKYQLFYKLSIEDVTDNWLSIGIYYEKEELLSGLGINKLAPYEVLKQDNHLFINKFHTKNVYEILSTDINTFNDLWGNLTNCELTLSSNIAARAFNLREKILDITPAIANQFTPNHLQYENFNGISFSKGCFLGQEIIARIKHRTTLQTELKSFILPDYLPELTNSIKVLDQDNKIVGTLLGHININSKQTLVLIISKYEIDPTKITFQHPTK